MVAHKMKEEEKDNIIMTCPTHSKETYFRIKKLERAINMEDYVYVWFKDKEDGDEKMWVRITKGTKIKGLGKLLSENSHFFSFVSITYSKYIDSFRILFK